MTELSTLFGTTVPLSHPLRAYHTPGRQISNLKPLFRRSLRNSGTFDPSRSFFLFFGFLLVVCVFVMAMFVVGRSIQVVVDVADIRLLGDGDPQIAMQETSVHQFMDQIVINKLKL